MRGVGKDGRGKREKRRTTNLLHLGLEVQPALLGEGEESFPLGEGRGDLGDDFVLLGELSTNQPDNLREEVRGEG